MTAGRGGFTEAASEAKRLVGAGRSVIPIRADGSKAPAIESWEALKHRRPTELELENWFGAGRRVGLAIIAGAVSGNAECIDFDEAALVPVWIEVVRASAPELAARLVVVRTPRPGLSVWYRCEAPVPGNLKLARGWRSDPEELDEQGEPKRRLQTLIETRGEGGYAIIPPSPAACHPRRKRYQTVRGDLAELPLLSAEERSVLIESARALNEYLEPEQLPRPARAGHAADRTRPGDDFNERGDWGDLLTRHGWKEVYRRGDASYWRRPGKTRGISASLGAVAPGVLNVFSTNAAPLANRGYGLFGAYGLLECGGDYKAAARMLSEQGYGAEKSATPALGAGVGRAANGREPETRGTGEEEEAEPDPLDALVYDGPALLAADIPEPEWLVPGLVAKRVMTMLVGTGKLGKSVLAHQLCVAAATGGVWLDQRLPVTRCLYVNWEDPLGLTRARAVQQFAPKTLPPEYHAMEPPWGTSFGQFLAWLVRYLPAHGIELAVIDPLAIAARWRDEKDNSETGPTLRNIQAVAQETQAAIFVVHHTRKMGGEEGLEVRGGSAIFGGIQGFLSFRRLGPGEYQLDTKDKMPGPHGGDKSLLLRREPQTLTWHVTGHVTPQEQEKQITVDEVLAHIRADPGITRAELEELLDLKESTLRSYLRPYLEDGRLAEQVRLRRAGDATRQRPPRGLYWTVRTQAEGT